MADETNGRLFSEDELCPWSEHWQNMPAYELDDLAPKYSVIVNFVCAGDVEEFGRLLGQPLRASNGRQLQSLWFPEQEIGRLVNKRYIEGQQ